MAKRHYTTEEVADMLLGDQDDPEEPILEESGDELSYLEWRDDLEVDLITDPTAAPPQAETQPPQVETQPPQAKHNHHKHKLLFPLTLMVLHKQLFQLTLMVLALSPTTVKVLL